MSLRRSPRSSCFLLDFWIGFPAKQLLEDPSWLGILTALVPRLGRVVSNQSSCSKRAQGWWRGMEHHRYWMKGIVMELSAQPQSGCRWLRGRLLALEKAGQCSWPSGYLPGGYGDGWSRWLLDKAGYLYLFPSNWLEDPTAFIVLWKRKGFDLSRGS